MSVRSRAAAGVALFCSFSIVYAIASEARAARPAGAPRPVALTFSQQNQLVADYCVSCHKAKGSASGDLRLADFDVRAIQANTGVTEKMIRKLRAGMMPPPGARRPDSATLAAFVDALESRIDTAAAGNPDPGWRPFQRLNSAEYARVVRDLLGLEVDVASFLPPDTISGGFDNVADVQGFSPVLMTGYLRAAREISRRAVSEPAARAKVVTCGSTASPRRREDACVEAALRRLTDEAYRGQATAADLSDAMAFYARGRKGGTADDGLRAAIQSILVSPRFLFKLEPAPADASGPYAIADQAIATRLSFFLWGTAPDSALRTAAARGALRSPAGLERQVRRMLADRRSEALATRFAVQWLRLQDLEHASPAPALFPGYDQALARAMRRETELFFDSIVREDRSILELFTASYSFVNDRLARHYGLPGITGPAFRRVPVPEPRRGLLGQGSILVSTSVADRTSPVLRGKWVMEVVLGTPPPPPPPNVPALDDSVKGVQGARRLSTRQRIEEHRRNPSCNACHRFMDPLGLALENFDAVGAWRTADNDVPIDPVGDLYDGTKMDGPTGLRQALLAHGDMVLRSFTENLLAYAIGRRIEPHDMPAIRAIVNRAAASDNRFSAFVMGVVNSPAFRMARPVAASSP